MRGAAVRHAVWVALAAASIGGAAIAADGVLHSGRAVGEPVPTFYVRAVTGPLENRSVCYVCRNGSRPVVMVLLRAVDRNVPRLLQELDREIDRHRAEGLRGFVVLLEDDLRKAIPVLQTLAFDNELQLPLTTAPVAIETAACQNVHPAATVTVVLYRNRRVKRRFAFRAGELDEPSIERIVKAVRTLLPPPPAGAPAAAQQHEP